MDDSSANVPRILTTAQDVDWPGTDAVRLGGAATSRLARFRQIALRASSYDMVLLNGAVSFSQWYDEILVAGLLARAVPDVCVVLEGCYWEEGTRILETERLVRGTRALGYDPPARRGRWFAHALVSWVRRPSVHYIVFGSDERRTFAATWSIPEARVVAMPYHSHAWAERFCQVRAHDDVVGLSDRPTPPRTSPRARGPREGHVFAGGNSLRDYRPLLKAAPSIPARIVIATTLPMPPTPPNVHAGALSEQDFRDQATRAAVHVVPVITDPPRSAGQASYLDALMLGIPVVVTDGPGVRDHIRDQRDALIVAPGDAVALAGAVNMCLSDAEVRTRLSTSGGARAATEFTLSGFRSREYTQLLSVWGRHKDARLLQRGCL